MSLAAAFSMQPTARVEFGLGALDRLAEVVASINGDRVFLVTDQGLRSAGVVDRAVGVLSSAGIASDVYDQITSNPSASVIDDAAEVAAGLDRPVVVGLGGGSSLDAAKAIALLATNPGPARSHGAGAVPAGAGLPVVAVPTTAGTGAETNGFAVIEDIGERRKIYLGHDSVRPLVSILDPELTVGLPAAVTAATGMDALVHGIESLASRGSNPLSATYATEAIRQVAANLRTAVEDGSDVEARAALMLGAHLAGLALSISGLGLVHGIAHTITSQTGAAHGLALSAVLDRVMECSVEAASSAYLRVASAMGVPADGAIRAARELADDVGCRLPLRALGVESALVPTIALGALRDPVSDNHPCAISRSGVEEILLRAL
jgi:alcohol dehydrogenase class IV